MDALAKWEGGAVMAISHDKAFLERLQPTHVLTVRGGKAVLEERGLKEADWQDDLNSRATEAKFFSTPIFCAQEWHFTGVLSGMV